MQFPPDKKSMRRSERAAEVLHQLMPSLFADLRRRPGRRSRVSHPSPEAPLPMINVWRAQRDDVVH